jgi:hypothetical protein
MPNVFSEQKMKRQARVWRSEHPTLARTTTANVVLIKQPNVYGVRFSPKGKRDKFIPETL